MIKFWTMQSYLRALFGPTPRQSRLCKWAAGPFAALTVLAATALETRAQISGTAARDDYIYKIGPEDRLEIIVRGEETLSGSHAVRPDGRLNLVLAGEIFVVGLTPQELEARIEDGLAPTIMDPEVTVIVRSASGTYGDRVRMIGDGLTAPRSMAYRQDLTLLALLTETGGLPPGAAGDRAYILRPRAGRYTKIPIRLDSLADQGAVGANRPLQPGDIVVVPRSFFAGDWAVTASLGVSETYTDNLFLASEGREDDALISELVPGVQATVDTDRFQAALNGNVRLQYIALSDAEDLDYAPDGQLSSTTEMIEDLFFLDASAGVSQQLLDTRRNGSANPSNIQNLSTTQAYRLSPYIETRLGRFAESRLRYTAGIVLIDREDLAQAPGFNAANDSIEHRGEVRVTSGPAFSSVRWTLSGTYAEIDVDDQPTRERQEAQLSLEIPVTDSVTLLATGGYQKFTGGNFGREVDDPLWLAGFRWAPSKATRLQVLAGQRDGNETVEASLTQRIGQSLSFSASYVEDVAIDQERLVRELPDTPDDVTDPDPLPRLTALSNQPSERKSANASLSGTLGLTQFSLSGSYQIQERGLADSLNDEETVRGTISISRPFARQLDGTLSGSYTRREFAGQGLFGGDRKDDIYFARAGLAYTATTQLSLNASYSYTRRDGTGSLIDLFGFGDFVENSVSLRANYIF